MLRSYRKALKDKSGVTAIEYGLIAGAIAVVIIGAVQTLGTTVSGTFTAVSNALTAQNGGGGGGGDNPPGGDLPPP